MEGKCAPPPHHSWEAHRDLEPPKDRAGMGCGGPTAAARFFGSRLLCQAVSEIPGIPELLGQFTACRASIFGHSSSFNEADMHGSSSAAKWSEWGSTCPLELSKSSTVESLFFLKVAVGLSPSSWDTGSWKESSDVKDQLLWKFLLGGLGLQPITIS